MTVVQISVYNKPNSKHREEVAPGDDDSLAIFTKSQATEGKPNDAAVQLLAE